MRKNKILNRFKLRFIAFVVVAVSLGWAWQHFRGVPFGNVSPWAAFPADVPAIVDYPDISAAYLTDTGAIASEFAFTGSLWEESGLLGQALGVWASPLTESGRVSATIGIHPAGSGRCSFSVVLDTRRPGFSIDQLLTQPEIHRVLPSIYQGHKIYTIYLKNQETFAVAAYRNLLIVARLPLLVEEAIGRLEWRPSGLAVQKRFRKMLPSAKISLQGMSKRIYIQTRQLPNLLSGIIHPQGMEEVRRWQELAEWVRLDLHKEKKGWRIQGAVGPPVNSHWAAVLAERRQIMTPEHLEVIPDNIAMLFLGSASNLSRLPDANKGAFRRYVASWAGRDFALAMGPPKGVDLPADWFAVVSVRQEDLAERRLSELAQQEGKLKDYAYQSFRIRQVMTDGLLPFFSGGRMENPFFTFIGNYVVFASTQAALEVWIDSFIAGKTLARDESFLPHLAQGKLPGAWFFYLPGGQLKPLFQSYAPKEPRFSTLIDILGSVALRATPEKSHWLIDGTGFRSFSESQHSTVAWKALLPAPAATPPYPVEDPLYAQTCIAVQDSSLRLHLIGPAGDIRWSKVLDGMLLSGVQHMDYYGDSSTTLLFNTAHSIYLLDMRGNDVGNFPLPLQSPATNGVSVVNFDGGFQMCFFIACANGNLYGFDRLGRPLQGWNPLSGAGTLRFPLMHFYKEDKDFLVSLNERGVMKVFRRDGGERLQAKTLEGLFLSPPDYQVSENSNRIVAANASGVVHVVGLKDEYFRLSCPVGQGKGVRFAFGALIGDERKDYVVISGEELALYAYGQGPNFEKVFSHRFESAQDDVFCLRLPGESLDRIGTVSRSSGKIYLLDAGGLLYPGFPLAGNTRFFAADLYRNGRPVIVTAFGDSVYAYFLR